jgi:hypothetical protein
MAERYSTANDVPRTPVRRSDTTADDYTVVAPLDRVRWSSVLAGLFATLAALAFFTVLGIALGFASFDANNPSSFGIGAGIYGAVSALIAFFLGGFLSARTAAVTGAGNGLVNGAMVWIVTIPLIVNVLGSGIGTLLNVATDVATTAVGAAAEVAAPVVDQAAEELANDPNAQATAQASATEVVAGAEGVIADAQQQLEEIDPADVERVAQDVSRAAWGALLALGLSALAAIGGGLAGTRTLPTDVVTVRRPEDART